MLMCLIFRCQLYRRCRVARWYIFKPKIPIWVHFGVPFNERLCVVTFMEIRSILLPFRKFYVHLVYIFCGHFGIFVPLWYVVPRKIWHPWFDGGKRRQKLNTPTFVSHAWLVGHQCDQKCFGKKQPKCFKIPSFVPFNLTYNFLMFLLKSLGFFLSKWQNFALSGAYSTYKRCISRLERFYKVETKLFLRQNALTYV
jgi:hypothetical protein